MNNYLHIVYVYLRGFSHLKFNLTCFNNDIHKIDSNSCIPLKIKYLKMMNNNLILDDELEYLEIYLSIFFKWIAQLIKKTFLHIKPW